MEQTTEQQPEPFSFANNFWGKEDNGVHVLLNHVNNTKHTAEEIRAFYKERASIEEEYSRRLTALSRKALGSHEVGTLKSALETIRSNTESLGKSHSNAAQQFRTELEEPLGSFSGNLRSRRKTVQSLMEKLTKAKVQQQNQVDRSREKFESDCNKINGYFAQQNLLLGKELERNNHKLDKAHVSIEVTKRDYQNSLRLLAESIDRWTQEWKISCDKLQDLEEERVNYLKSNLWAYTNIVSTVCVSDDEGCENIRISLEKCDVNKDIEIFVRERGTGAEILDPPEFVNFMNGNGRDDKTRGYKVAQFTRVSSVDEMQDYFDPNASMGQSTMGQSMMRNSVSLARSSAASCMSEATDAQTVVINKGAGISAPVAANTSASNRMGFEPSMDVNSLSTNSAASADQANFQSIPVLSHPQDSSDYQITPQPSPVQQQVMSREGSLYSNTSVSSQSDLEVNDQSHNRQMQKPQFDRRAEDLQPAPPIIQEPVLNDRSPQLQYQQQQQPQQEAPSPRRTWASPFRRRSKKDLNKDWNSSGPVETERTNTLTSTKLPFGSSRAGDASSPGPQSTYRSSFGNAPDSTSSSPTKKGPSTMLSMGDNMFDLGVSPNKSPFDQRSKSASPVKSLARDDPLVMALEKLKLASGGSEPQEEQPVEPMNQYGGLGNGAPASKPKRVSSRSAPVSPARNGNLNNGGSMRHGNNSSTALIPPQPAFTATDMNSTSRKYSNQTKEMFHYEGGDPNAQQQQQQMQNQRPRSNTGGSFRGGPGPQDRAISPRPSNGALQQQQQQQQQPQQQQQQRNRPQTMYEMNSYQEPNHGGYRNSGSEADFGRRGSYNAQGNSPNPDYTGNAPPRGGSVSPAPYGNDMRRSMSPNPMMRAASPNPQMQQGPPQDYRRSASPNPQMQQGPPHDYRRSASPNPQMQQGPPQDYRRSASPNPGFAPPQPQYIQRQQSQQSMYQRAASPMDYNRGGNAGPPRSVSPHPYQPPQNNYQRAGSARSNYYGGNSQYDLDPPGVGNSNGPGGQFHGDGGRQPRSKSALNMRGGGPGASNAGGPVGLPSVSRDGRPVLRYCRAAYDYRAAIPEEVSFRAGEILLVVRMLEDGWWEAETLSDGRIGLAPSNFLKNM